MGSEYTVVSSLGHIRDLSTTGKYGFGIDIDDNFKKADDTYYFKELNYNKKKGYIQISKIGENYFVEYVFNYAKMEAYAKSKNLVSVVNNMSYVLRSIKYNDKMDIPALQESIQRILESDASLRTRLSIVDGTVMQYYEPYVQEEIPVFDFSSTSAAAGAISSICVRVKPIF